MGSSLVQPYSGGWVTRDRSLDDGGLSVSFELDWFPWLVGLVEALLEVEPK